MRIISADTLRALKENVIDSQVIFEGLKNEEFYIEVAVPIHHHARFLARDAADKLAAYVKIDGKSIGYFSILSSTPSRLDHMYLGDQKMSLMLVEPDKIPFHDVEDAKENARKNKDSTVGCIQVKIWTIRRKVVKVAAAAASSSSSSSSAAAAAAAAVATLKPKVGDTKKFYEQPSLGIGAGRALGSSSSSSSSAGAGKATTTTQTTKVKEIGDKTVRVQTAVMCQLLRQLEMQKEISRKLEAEGEAEAEAGSGDGDGSGSGDESGVGAKRKAAQITFIDLAD